MNAWRNKPNEQKSRENNNINVNLALLTIKQSKCTVRALAF